MVLFIVFPFFRIWGGYIYFCVGFPGKALEMYVFFTLLDAITVFAMNRFG